MFSPAIRRISRDRSLDICRFCNRKNHNRSSFRFNDIFLDSLNSIPIISTLNLLKFRVRQVDNKPRLICPRCCHKLTIWNSMMLKSQFSLIITSYFIVHNMLITGGTIALDSSIDNQRPSTSAALFGPSITEQSIINKYVTELNMQNNEMPNNIMETNLRTAVTLAPNNTINYQQPSTSSDLFGPSTSQQSIPYEHVKKYNIQNNIMETNLRTGPTLAPNNTINYQPSTSADLFGPSTSQQSIPYKHVKKCSIENNIMETNLSTGPTLAPNNYVNYQQPSTSAALYRPPEQNLTNNHTKKLRMQNNQITSYEMQNNEIQSEDDDNELYHKPFTSAASVISLSDDDNEKYFNYKPSTSTASVITLSENENEPNLHRKPCISASIFAPSTSTPTLTNNYFTELSMQYNILQNDGFQNNTMLRTATTSTPNNTIQYQPSTSADLFGPSISQHTLTNNYAIQHNMHCNRMLRTRATYTPHNHIGYHQICPSIAIFGPSTSQHTSINNYNTEHRTQTFAPHHNVTRHQTYPSADILGSSTSHYTLTNNNHSEHNSHCHRMQNIELHNNRMVRTEATLAPTNIIDYQPSTSASLYGPSTSLQSTTINNVTEHSMHCNTMRNVELHNRMLRIDETFVPHHNVAPHQTYPSAGILGTSTSHYTSTNNNHPEHSSHCHGLQNIELHNNRMVRTAATLAPNNIIDYQPSTSTALFEPTTSEQSIMNNNFTELSKLNNGMQNNEIQSAVLSRINQQQSIIFSNVDEIYHKPTSTASVISLSDNDNNFDFEPFTTTTSVISISDDENEENLIQKPCTSASKSAPSTSDQPLRINNYGIEPNMQVNGMPNDGIQNNGMEINLRTGATLASYNTNDNQHQCTSTAIFASTSDQNITNNYVSELGEQKKRNTEQ